MLLMMGLTIIHCPALAEDVETANHTFAPPTEPPPTAMELQRASDLSEKYITGQITAEELTELHTLKSDLTHLDVYRAKYVEGQKFSSNDEVVVPVPTQEMETMSNIETTGPVQSIPLWLLVLVFSNTALMITIALLLLLQARRSHRPRL